MKIDYTLLCIILVVSSLTYSLSSYGTNPGLEDPYAPHYILFTDSVAQDTVPLKDRQGDFINDRSNNPFDLKDPSAITKEVEYNPETGYYIIREKIGENDYRPATYMTFEEYQDYQTKQQQDNYFKALGGVETDAGGAGTGDPMSRIDIKNNLADRLFGGSNVDIRPQGNIDLTFGVDFQKVENPRLTLRQQRQGGFDFDMNIQMNVEGQIGEKLKLSTSYNTQATFDFENQMKLRYDSEAFSEDDIIKDIQAGNVSFPLQSSLIQGSQNLFGFKIDTQWGKLKLSMVASQQKSRQQQLKLEGGSQLQEFEVRADEYDENRHFFLTHYNRETFTPALENLPQIKTLFKINPGDLDVWITNDRGINENDAIRDIVAIGDLGEPQMLSNQNPDYQAPTIPFRTDITGIPLPSNQANPIYRDLVRDPAVRNIARAVATLTGPQFRFQQTRDFEKVSARKLRPSEYTFHPELGYISLNFNLKPDQVLGVSFRYDYNGQVYQVGEPTTESPQVDTTKPPPVIFVKMLKSTTPRIDLPLWDLMMKNIYSLGAFQVSQEDFRLDIYYDDPKRGDLRFLPESNLEGTPLLRVFNLDILNVQGDPCPDGIFDFVPGLTIQPRNGRIMFPVLEPFGEDLVEDITDPALKEKFNYFHLYDSTVTRAREYPDFNRFVVRGEYKSSSGGAGSSREISLGAFNLPRGSVRVTAGGTTLTEGADYEVDYNIGRVTILRDDLLNSGVPVNVSFEDNTLFGFQTKSLIGLRADYEVKEDFNVGATYLHLFERPFTEKVNIGDDPINNSIYGLDMNFTTEAPWLTRLVDKIPLINTKEPSSLSFQAEAAYLKPGHARAINEARDEDGNRQKGGAVLIDDFEGSTSGFDLRTPVTKWVLSSVPQNDPQNNNPLFPESAFIDTTLSGVNRARLLWYRLDPSLNDSTSNNYTAFITPTEVFPNFQPQPGTFNNVQTFDMTFQPSIRGPYNFDLPNNVGGTDFSEGILQGGNLNRPETRWGGIMRDLPITDFERANVEFIEFWMLNPFENGPASEGELYFNLGNISEDILRDSRRFFENGLPVDGNRNTRVDTTRLSRIPRVLNVVSAFDNDEARRTQQDLGLDGFDDEGERAQFQDIIDQYTGFLTPAALSQVQNDPSNDNFEYFRNYPNGTSLITRYSRFNGTEGNSQSPSQNTSPFGNDNRLNSSTNIPDTEDLNRDNTLNESEAYFQYRIPLRSKNSNIANYSIDTDATPFVTDSIEGNNGRIWYRFKVPIDQYTERVGGIQDFRSIRFIRMYMHGFEAQTTLRFARLELARNQWRRYRRDLVIHPNLPILRPNLGDQIIFDVNAVNIEENSSRPPYGYKLPPGIRRERSNQSAFADRLQNEQSLTMEACNLPPDEGRGIYKNVNFDLRLYENLKMFVHAETKEPRGVPTDDSLAIFVRLGSDFNNNYYEYEMPLVFSQNIDTVVGGDPQSADPRTIWPKANEMVLDLKQLIDVKLEREASGVPLNAIYEFPESKLKEEERAKNTRYRIIGNPNLGPVKSIMFGIVNRGDDDFCGEVWVNELRVTGLDEQGGFAALAQVDMKLADFGDLGAAFRYVGTNFGQLEDRLPQRTQEETIQFDISSNLELGKFFGEKAGIKIPTYLQYSKTIINPEFDPYTRDVPLKKKIAEASPGNRDSIRQIAQEVSELKSVNFTNVRKVSTKQGKNKKPMPWDIENFSVSYSLTQASRRDPFIESDEITTHNGAFDYGYSRSGKFITPFKKLIKKDKYLKLFSEFNFNPLPNSFSFNTTANRELQVTKYRFTDLAEEFSTFYNKQFTWDRNYDLRWDFTKSLKFSFNASNQAVIDELKEFDDGGRRRSPEELRAFIWENIRKGGRTKNYAHGFDLSYTAPLKYIPMMDWITVKGQYNADYTWSAAALNVDSLGNVITNGQKRQVTADLNFENLYRKSKYLNKFNKSRRGNVKNRAKEQLNNRRPGSSGRGRGKNRKEPTLDKVDSPESIDERVNSGNNGLINKDGSRNRGSRKRSTPEEKTPPPSNDKNKTFDNNGNPTSPTGSTNPSKAGDKKGSNKVTPPPKRENISKEEQKRRDKVEKQKEKERKEKQRANREPSVAERILIRPLLLLRKAKFTYSEDLGTVVPGFLPQTSLMGQSSGFEAPGWDFVAGLQPDISNNDFSNDWLTRAARNGWISDNIQQNQQVTQNKTQDIRARITLEPFKDFRIDLDANRRIQRDKSIYFRDTTLLDDPNVPSASEIVHAIPREIGSYSISFFTLQTFMGTDVESLFTKFDENRAIISQRLGTGAHDLEGSNYSEGFGQLQQNVLIPAFLAAYTDDDASTVPVDPNYTNVLFDLLPKINWQLTYNGLSKIEALKKIFSNFSLTHGYKSTLTVNSFNTNTFFEESQPFIKSETNQNFYSKFNIPDIVIDEQFAPLIGINMEFKNEMGIRFDMKKSRNLRLSFTDNRLHETNTEEFVVGFDYQLKDVEFAFLSGGKKKQKKTRRDADKDNKTGNQRNNPSGRRGGNTNRAGDLNMAFDFSFRDDVTKFFGLEDGNVVTERGLKTIRISPSIDYDLNDRVNIRLFFERSQTIPATSASFPITNTQGGVTVRFSLN